MPDKDPYRRLFKGNLEIILPGGDVEAKLRELSLMGLVELNDREYVLCVNPLDPDQEWVKDSNCPGRVILDPALKESNRDYRCNECGRILYPSGKEKFKAICSNPALDAIEAFIQDQISGVAKGFRQVRRGHYVFEGESGVAEVCVVDLCAWQGIYADAYGKEGVVFVVGNEADLIRRLPERTEFFNLADLVFGDKIMPFEERLRRLVKAARKKPLAAGPRTRRSGTGMGQPAVMPEPPPWEGSVRFPVQRGTKWNQITLFFDLGSLGILAPGHTGEKYATPTQLKMVKGTRDTPTARWHLLERILEYNGSIDRWKSTTGYDNFNALKNEMSLLRRHLQYVFGLYSDPFSFFSRADGIKTAFVARRDKPEKGPHIDTSDWPDR